MSANLFVEKYVQKRQNTQTNYEHLYTETIRYLHKDNSPYLQFFTTY